MLPPSVFVSIFDRSPIGEYLLSPSAGSCFTVSLPRLQCPATIYHAPAIAGTRSACRSLDLLVVDDNADAAEMVKLLLEGSGHRVVEHDPLRALQQAASRPPHAAFIDIGLPAMDGYELVRRLRSSPATATALYVAFTGYGREADRSKALAAGFDEHLVKPADPDRLLAVLERVRIQ